MSAILLRQATALSLEPPLLTTCDLRIEAGRISARDERLEAGPDDDVVEMAGRIVLPGFVCAHTHLYSALARGMPAPAEAPAGFPQILERVWWRLDRALDADSIYWSAVAGALDAVRCGVTTLVDHHASPNAIPGSLDRIRLALREVGLRGVLCYEVSDRDGPERRDQGLAENRRFIQSCRSETLFAGLVGGHASFTLGDESLRRLGELAAELDVGVHIHLAEDASDGALSRERYGAAPVDRLARAGLLRRDSLLAHCIHLDDREARTVRESGAWMIHNPRSNMNNGVGAARLREFGTHAALGSDGFVPDMFEEQRAAWFKNREAAVPAPDGAVLGLLNNGQHLAGRIFGRSFGRVEVGAEADLVVLDYRPPTPMTPENAAFHLLFGARTSMVRSVMVAGRWILRDRVFTRVDEKELLCEARRAAGRLWGWMNG